MYIIYSFVLTILAIYVVLIMQLFPCFQVNLNKNCPFWADDQKCMLSDCAVKKCTDVSGNIFQKFFFFSFSYFLNKPLF